MATVGTTTAARTPGVSSTVAIGGAEREGDILLGIGHRFSALRSISRATGICGVAFPGRSGMTPRARATVFLVLGHRITARRVSQRGAAHRRERQVQLALRGIFG